MPIHTRIIRNSYRDSLALMRISESLAGLAGVRRATLLMGTPANKALLADARLMRSELEPALPGDLMLVLEAESEPALAGAATRAAELLAAGPAAAGGEVGTEEPPRSIAMALSQSGHANFAQISVPGPYAGAEAMKALRSGLNVFLFSDNVPLAHEVAIKALSQRKGLLVMGPDCGTAIVNGVPLGFANVVRRGAIGLLGASGTGLQQVSCAVHALGEGISHAIGTGGRDGSDEVGGVTLFQGLELLAADADTRVIAIVSKPLGAQVAAELLRRAARAGKPVVVLFLGSRAVAAGANTHVVANLDDAARAAVSLAQGAAPRAPLRHRDAPRSVAAETARLMPSQRYLRGLYAGGTFCTEAQFIWRELGLRVRSNVPLIPGDTLPEARHGIGHSAMDLGSDEYTVGRAHPMIDAGARCERIVEEARDPAVAALVLDVVLGYAGHRDPAGALAPAIRSARAHAAKEGRYLPVVGFVCGTEGDPQRLSAQEATLRAEGVLLAPCSTEAARWAGAIAQAAASGMNHAADRSAGARNEVR